MLKEPQKPWSSSTNTWTLSCKKKNPVSILYCIKKTSTDKVDWLIYARYMLPNECCSRLLLVNITSCLVWHVQLSGFCSTRSRTGTLGDSIVFSPLCIHSFQAVPMYSHDTTYATLLWRWICSWRTLTRQFSYRTTLFASEIFFAVHRVDQL